MRIIRLVSDAYAVEFHPYVTVVPGLTETQRAELVGAFEAGARGETAGFRGLLEAHGVLMDFDEPSLHLLELDTVSTRIVVTADDLPGSGSTGIARQLHTVDRQLDAATERLSDARHAAAAAESAVAAATAAVDDTVARRDAADEIGRDGEEKIAAARAELDEALAEADAAQDAVVEAEQALRVARDRLAEKLDAQSDLITAVDRAAAEVDDLDLAVAAAKDARDPFAAAALEAAELAVQQVQQAIDDEREAARAEEDELASRYDGDPEASLARVEQEIDEIDEHLAMSTPFDPEPLRYALEIHRGGVDSSIMVPSARALSLAERLDELGRRLAAAAEIDVPNPSELADARARRAAALDDMFRAEQAVQVPQIEPADVELLEKAHEEVLAAQDRTEGRFGGARAERRLDEARATEAKTLERLGFPTYADYMMGTSILHVDTDDEAKLEAARTALAEAEEVLAELERRVDGELEIAALLEERRGLRAEAREIVGRVPDADLTTALQNVRVPDDPDFSPLGELRQALIGVGMPVGDEPFTASDLAAMAERWLDEYNRVRDHGAALRRQRAERESERSEILAFIRELERRAIAGDPEADRVARLDKAIGQRDIAAQRVVRHDNAVAELESHMVDLERARDELRAAEMALAERADERNEEEDEVAAAEEVWNAARTDLDEARERVAAQQQAVDDLEAAVTEARSTDFVAAVQEVESALLVAETQRADAEASLVEADAAQRSLGEEAAALRSALAELEGRSAPAEEVEWYLLARLASQRHVSFAGSVPLVVVDALGSVSDDELTHLLERLERMAGAVQVVHFTDDPRIIAWAENAGENRVSVQSALTPQELAHL